MASGPDMQKELFELRRQMEEKTDESLESTRRMLTMCVESQDAGAKTLTMLDEQGEKLDKIEDGLTHINEDMKEARKNLRDLDKCCGLCILPWKRTKKVKIDETSWKSVEDEVVCKTPKSTLTHSGVAEPQGPFIKRITNDACEDEMEQNLAGVSGIVSNLKEMALGMHKELNDQNDQISRIQIKAGIVDDNVQKANIHATKIVGGR